MLLLSEKLRVSSKAVWKAQQVTWAAAGSNLKPFDFRIRTIILECVWIQERFSSYFEEKILFQRFFLESVFVITFRLTAKTFRLQVEVFFSSYHQQNVNEKESQI